MDHMEGQNGSTATFWLLWSGLQCAAKEPGCLWFIRRDSQQMNDQFKVNSRCPRWFLSIGLHYSRACIFAQKYCKINSISLFFLTTQKLNVYINPCVNSDRKYRPQRPMIYHRGSHHRTLITSLVTLVAVTGQLYVDKTEGWENQDVTVGVAKWQWLQFIIRTKTSWLAEKFYGGKKSNLHLGK